MKRRTAPVRNFSPLPWPIAHVVHQALAGLTHPVPCRPEVLLPIPRRQTDTRDSDDRRDIRSGICGRCGNRFQWAGGHRTVRYCDGCARY